MNDESWWGWSDEFHDHMKRHRWIMIAREDSVLPGEPMLSEVYHGKSKEIIKRRSEHYDYLPTIFLSLN